MKTETNVYMLVMSQKMASQEKFQFIKVQLLNMTQVFKWEDYLI